MPFVVTTPSLACTAESLEVGCPLDGAASGTQMLAHEPVQATLEPLSLVLV